MGRVENKVAVVTGGGQGLGKAVSLLLAKEGAKVVVADIAEAPGNAVVEQIRLSGGVALLVRHDVADESSWEALIERTIAEFGRLDILVNNAAVFYGRTIEATSLQKWRWLMGVNLDSVFLGVKHGIQAMKRNTGGSIVNIASVSAKVAYPNTAAYAASKAGVRALSRVAAIECSKAGLGYNIRVNTILPGSMKTRMLDPLVTDEAEYQRQARMHPIGRFGEPEEVAAGVLYLASDEAAFTTGSELVIDGGWTAQ